VGGAFRGPLRLAVPLRGTRPAVASGWPYAALPPLRLGWRRACDPLGYGHTPLPHGRFWRGFVDEQVRRYLDCGLYENGFARVRCPECRTEYLLAFSCKTRELCPSCAAKRAAVTAALLRDDVLEEVGHSQWVFVMPKMLRLYFLHHRELFGGLARAAWETVLELRIEATREATLRPGMVAVVQTAGELARWHTHVHALVSRG